MKKQFKSWTLVFILGSIAIPVGFIVSIILMNGSSAPDALFGMYVLMSLIPMILVVGIDRLLVWKFGNTLVNKVEFSIMAFVALLWIVRFAMDLMI
ncbi:hypothetical protein [Chryseobacterium sp. Mn2064]|uniref:hypothetical protein n=1 Tax=Chryseobacterium sp. Mn2064 TaxID=3395263 RepID=UPI003BDC2810